MHAKSAAPHLDKGHRDSSSTCRQLRQAAPPKANVTTDYDFEFITPLTVIAPMFGGTIDGGYTLSGTGVMVCTR